MRPEDAIQKLIVKAARAMGYLVVKIDNEGKRSYKTAAYLKAMGLCPGASDLAIVGRQGRVLWLEVKSPNGRLSDNQQDFGDALVSHGHLYSVCRSYDEALAALAKLQMGKAA